MYWRLALITLAAMCGSVQAQSDRLKIVGRFSDPGSEPLVLVQFRTMQTLPRDAELGYYRKTWLRVMLGRHADIPGTFRACYCKYLKKCGPLKAEFRFPSDNKGEIITTTETLKIRG